MEWHGGVAPTMAARRRGSAAWQRVRRMAFERDRRLNARCWICGAPIDYSLGLSKRSGTPWAYEPDHYLDVSRHPDLEYDIGNLRPAHSKCNRARGKRASTHELGKPSRNW
ncbi:HNH endonuclease domain protein [Olsenella profusa F0195]|uniref:HNH endonuclease domain protein n=2 Tax=Olsenella profusa TaxID=138595 RepID=U2T4Q7_9ACTN|nr:HNH endonuclease domain protein [Olsenella profusa F0195]